MMKRLVLKKVYFMNNTKKTEPIKSKFLLVIIIVAVVIAGFMLLTSDLEHIEDTNGPDNYRLQQITDDNIVNMDIGAMGVGRSNNTITNMTKISSDKFTGVYEVLYTNLIGKSDFMLDIYGLNVKSGNFKMVIVHDGKIVKTMTEENYEETLIEDINGTVSLVIAGESADFSFEMTTFEYDSFEHR